MPLPLIPVITAIDEANSKDPQVEIDEGRPVPAALLYGRRMTATLSEFVVGPSPELQIAARGQHVERWLRPRAAYPAGRQGYLAWRRDAGRYHADRVGQIMRSAGCAAAACDRVGSLIRKERLKEDAETQALEDVACLVFMRWYLPPFTKDRAAADLERILVKTARKMSPAGRQAALALPLPPEVTAGLRSIGG